MGFTSPARGLPSFDGLKPMGVYVGGQDAAGQHLLKVTVHSHYSSLTLFSCLLFRELDFINMNMPPTVTVVTARVTLISCWHLIQLLPSSLRWWC